VSLELAKREEPADSSLKRRRPCSRSRLKKPNLIQARSLIFTLSWDAFDCRQAMRSCMKLKEVIANLLKWYSNPRPGGPSLMERCSRRPAVDSAANFFGSFEA